MYKIIPLDKDKKVMDFETLKRIPTEGIIVRNVSTYWRNRKTDGDVSIEEVKKDKKDKK